MKQYPKRIGACLNHIWDQAEELEAIVQVMGWADEAGGVLPVDNLRDVLTISAQTIKTYSGILERATIGETKGGMAL